MTCETTHHTAHEATLRLEVGLLRRRETRRSFDPVVHVGAPSSTHASLSLPRDQGFLVDAALRTDVLCALLEASDAVATTVWLTRAGEPEPHDGDLGWAGAARHAFALHGRRLDGCYVVTRYGWLDPVSGCSRRWKRLRL